MDRGRRGVLVFVIALMLSFNNGVYAALALFGPSVSGVALATQPPTVSFVDYAQCANDSLPSSATNCPGGWINGILNAQNSHYPEDAVTPQRAEVSYPAGDAITGATLTFKYETTKGGIHAYDSLATWNYTQSTANKDQGLNAAVVVGGTASTLQMASDPTASTHELPAADRMWTMFGGTLTGTTVPLHDCTTSTTQCTTDDYAEVKVTYNVPASDNPRYIQLLFGGHIAPSNGARGWGQNLGAANVSGGPYHIKWTEADGASIGNRDNQITSRTIVVPPSLTITKTTSTPSVALGGTATFTIAVTNSAASTDTATGVTVTDTLPTGFTFAAMGTVSGGSRTATVEPTAGQTNLTFGTWSINPGDTVSITFTATAPTSGCQTYNNNAAFTSTNAGSGTTSTPAAVTVTGCSASLSITKTTSTSSVALGGAATFTITVTNAANATATATGVHITDSLPAGFAYASTTSQAGTGTLSNATHPTAGDTSLDWGTWSLAPGQTAAVTFTATAPSSANSCQSYENNGGYTSTNAGSGSTTSPATVTVTGCTGDLSVTKTTSTSSVALGGTATFTITVTNAANATLTATGVQISDTLPTGFSFASMGTVGGTGTRTATLNPTAGQTSLTFGTWSLAPGQTASVTFSATAPSGANSCGSYDNNASVASGNDGSASTQSPATVTVTGCSASLSITKTTSTSSVALGGTATFTVTVTNAANATATATGVQVTDALPAGFTFAAMGTVTGGTRTATLNPTAGDTSLTFGTWSLAPGETVSIGFTATAPSSANSCKSYDNNAGFTSDNAGSGSTTSPATVTVTGCSASLSITKTTSTSSVALGGAATFTITVTNSANASATATGVHITDALPAGFAYASTTSQAGTGTLSSPTSPTVGDTSLDWGTWSLAPGQTAVVTFTATAPSAANSCTTYNNNAAYTSTNAGSASTTSPATVTVTGCSASLSITKTTSTASVALGGTATFTITVTNAANATLTATGVQITDTLPAGFVYASTVSQDGTGTLTNPSVPAAGDTNLTFGTWSLAPGETAAVTFEATAPSTANSCGSYENNAGFTSENAGSGSTQTPATVRVTGCAPGVTITKTTSTSSVALGGAATFTITVTNAANATGTATGVQISDTLPTGFTFASGTVGGTGTRTATSDPTAGQTSLTWGTWSLAPGQTATVTFSATAPTSNSSCGTYSNNATVTWNPENEARTTSPATVTVTGCFTQTPTPQLSISKTADASLVTAAVNGGSTVGFTITLTNTGTISTTASLTDTPLVAAGPTTPAGNAGTNGLTWSIDAAHSDAGCTVTGTTLSCNFGTLGAGQSKHVHITAPVTARTTATSRADNCGQRVDNVATAFMGNGNGVTSNHATVDIACLPTTSTGNLTIVKYSDNNGNGAKDNGEPFLAGWTFEIKNNATGAVKTATTGANGTATVTDLEFGQYTVTEKSCASPCDSSKWTAVSYQVGGGAVVKSSSGSAQVAIASADQSVTFGNRPPQLPSTSTNGTSDDRLPSAALLLLAALLSALLALRLRGSFAMERTV